MARKRRVKYGSIVRELRGQAGHVPMAICLGVRLQLGKPWGEEYGLLAPVK